MDNFIPQNGTFLATISGSIVVFSGLLYKVYRMIKGDLRDDKTVQNVDKFVETQNNKIRELEDLNKILSDKVEVLQKERANLMQLSGQVQGELSGLKLRLDDYKEQRDQKDKELQIIKEELAKIKLQNDELLRISDFIKPRNTVNQQQSGDIK